MQESQRPSAELAAYFSGGGRILRLLVIAIISLLAPLAMAVPLKVEDFTFEGPLGSQGAKIEATGENHFIITLGHAPNHPDWPNKLQFRILRHAKGNSLKLDVVFLPGPKYCFNEYFQSWSYDGINWNPIQWPLGRYKSPQKDSLTFPVFTEDSVIVGTQVPLSYETLEAMITEWNKSPHVKTQVLGKSLEDRNLYRLVITDANSSHPRKKRWVHWFSQQHPGEHLAQWRMVGIINWLLSKEGADCRRRSIVHIMPITSPDAPSKGWYRVNAQGIDMNRAYMIKGASKETQAHEAYIVQRDLEKLMASSAPPTTVWAMHTWGGNTDPRILPGPEMKAPLGSWKTLRDIIEKYDPKEDNLIRLMVLKKTSKECMGYWTNGPHKQFGVTAILCEGGATLHTKEKNMQAGVVLIKALAEYYKGVKP
jgi:Zinc carboxypeptidase